MAFVPKAWSNTPGVTPLNATGLVDLETRVTTYADSVGTTSAVNTQNSGAAITLGAPATYAINDITLTAATPALTLPSAVAGQSFTLVLRQDGTGGRLPSWVGTVKWPGGAAPTLTAAISAVDVVTFICVITGTWFGFPAGYDVK